MLTSGDDYPLHQLPEPIAYASGERNFYDRYFFNGYSRDASVFFAAALGVYPQLGVMDAAFSVIVDGVQHNLRASRSAPVLDRMQTRVGPIAVEVLEPLRSLAVRVESIEHGIDADLVFTGRSAPLEEPRFVRRAGARTLMDLTRLTQNGEWSGRLALEGRSIAVEPGRFWGTRDRSWGLRGVGEPDPQPVPGAERQFYWLWAPINFEDRVALFLRNEDGGGRPWASWAALLPLDRGQAGGGTQGSSFDSPHAEVELRPGTRHARRAVLRFGPAARGAGEVTVELESRFEFFMSGIGYLHPQWGHGRNRGELAVGFDSEPLAGADPNHLLHLHVQALCDATLRLGDGSEQRGQGVLEQLILGRHAPSGLED